MSRLSVLFGGAALALMLLVGLPTLVRAETPLPAGTTSRPVTSQPAASVPAAPPPAVSIHGEPAPSPQPQPKPKAPRPVAKAKPTLAPTSVKPPLPPEQRALRRHPAIGRRWFVGAGFSLGFFNPGGVNGYLEAYQRDLGPTISESGFASMVVYLVPRLAVSVNLGKYVQLSALGELGWGPKVVSSNRESRLFSFLRFSGGLLATFHLPLSVLRGDSLFLGGGPLLHHMRFEEFSATTAGMRVKAGYRLYEGIMMIEGFVAFDYARKETSEPMGSGISRLMVLDFSGLMFGATVHFGLF